jgi:hypothetical protein
MISKIHMLMWVSVEVPRAPWRADAVVSQWACGGTQAIASMLWIAP